MKKKLILLLVLIIFINVIAIVKTEFKYFESEQNIDYLSDGTKYFETASWE